MSVSSQLSKLKASRGSTGTSGGDASFTIRFNVDDTKFKASTLKAQVALKKLDQEAKATNRSFDKLRLKRATNGMPSVMERLGQQGKRTGGPGFRTSGVVFGGGIKMGRGGFVLEKDEILSRSRGILAGVAITNALGGILNTAADASDFLDKYDNLSTGQKAEVAVFAIGKSGNKALAQISGLRSLATGLVRLGAGNRGSDVSQAQAEAGFDRIIDDHFTTQLEKNAKALDATEKAGQVHFNYIVQSEKFLGSLAANGPKNYRLAGKEGRKAFENDIERLRKDADIIADIKRRQKLVDLGRPDLANGTNRDAEGS